MLLDGLSNDYFNGKNRSATQKKYNWPRRTQYWLADEKRGRYWHKQRLINCRLIQIIQFLAQNPSAGGRFCLIEKKMNWNRNRIGKVSKVYIQKVVILLNNTSSLLRKIYGQFYCEETWLLECTSELIKSNQMTVKGFDYIYININIAEPRLIRTPTITTQTHMKVI